MELMRDAWSLIDPDELLEVVQNAYRGGAVSYGGLADHSRNVIGVPGTGDGAAVEIVVGTGKRLGTVVSIRKGPRFDPAKWDDCAEVVDSALIAPEVRPWQRCASSSIGSRVRGVRRQDTSR